jgi:short-subunit dehydrogenase
VVTGASSGIGAEFARQLAGAGLAVVAVARRQGLPEALAGEIHDKGGRCEVLAADLTDAADRMRVGEVIAQPDVAMLVNNAGASTHGEFLQVPWSLAGTMVTLNVAAAVELSRWAADAFAARRRGAILNVSSTAAFKPMAGLVVSGATKAFVKEFSPPRVVWATTLSALVHGCLGLRGEGPCRVPHRQGLAGRCASSPAPEPRGGVEAGEVAGVALEPEMRP